MGHATIRGVLGGLVLALSGCAITPEKFGEDFVPLYCEAWDACVTSGRPCPVTLEGSSFDSLDCAFDKASAKECLGGDFTCDTTVPGFEIVVTPDACLADRICGL